MTGEGKWGKSELTQHTTGKGNDTEEGKGRGTMKRSGVGTERGESRRGVEDWA